MYRDCSYKIKSIICSLSGYKCRKGNVNRINKFFMQNQESTSFSFQRDYSINCGTDFPSHAIKHVWLDYVLNQNRLLK